MWLPLGSIWVILGDKKQACLPAVRPFTHHICPHSTVLPSKPAKAICHPAPRSARPGRAELVQAYHLFPDGEGASVLKFSLLQLFFVQCVKYNIFFFFLFYLQWQSGKKHHVSWRSGTGRGLNVSSFCHISMLNWTSGHNEQDDFCIHVCVIRQEPLSCI